MSSNRVDIPPQASLSGKQARCVVLRCWVGRCTSPALPVASRGEVHRGRSLSRYQKGWDLMLNCIFDPYKTPAAEDSCRLDGQVSRSICRCDISRARLLSAACAPIVPSSPVSSTNNVPSLFVSNPSVPSPSIRNRRGGSVSFDHLSRATPYTCCTTWQPLGDLRASIHSPDVQLLGTSMS